MALNAINTDTPRWYFDFISPVVRGLPFWGNDAHGFAMAVLENPKLLDDPEMRRVEQLPASAKRAS